MNFTCTGSSEDVDCNTISTATSWEYVSKSSSLSDLTRFGAAFSSSSKNNHSNHNHEIAQSSAISSSHLQNNQNGHRGFLPHGIVHLPPSHRNYSHHLNGFNGYRLTQKDLLQPQQTSADNNGFVPSSVFSGSPITYTASKDDSNPVMRSTSFNLDTGAARRYNFKFRQQNTPTPPGQQNQQQPNKGPVKKPQQKGFVFLAENPENGACDVYNVPFQSDIYSLPVDSIATSPAKSNNKKVGRSNSICTSKFSSANFTATNIPITNPLPPPPSTTSTATKASSSISHRENHNQNQRLKSSEPVITASSSSVSNTCTNNSNGDATPPPPQRKNNLNRRRSREEETSGIALETCNIRCPPAPVAAQCRESSKKPPAPQPPTQQLEEPGPSTTLGCKPPQRWSSLAAVQPSSSSPPKKEILPVIPDPASSSASTTTAAAAVKQSGATSSTITKPPPPPPHHHHLTSTYSTNNAFPESIAKLTSEKSSLNLSSNHCSSSNNLVVGKTLNLVAKAVESSCINKVSSSSTGASCKKPRSRSVDPSAAASADISEPSHRQSIKCSGTTTTNANQRTSSVNISYADNPNNHPLPPEPVESSPLSLFHSSSNKDSNSTTADRRNPLGLSFLNLFRRNKSGGGSSSGNGATSGKVPNSQQNSDCEFTALVPTNEENGGSVAAVGVTNTVASVNINNNKEDTSYYFRELPPPPPGEHSEESGSEGQGSPTTSPMECRDFAASIERVKDCGWYWGPLSSEHAEDLLKNEPDGSFIVRDSSDARYIFSLTFKLHGLVRHVRIEHDQGNFSFGPLTRFKAATIVDFVEKAVAHSRSGRYLFFLHRRPVLGPMQVQLLHPYSRFMHPRSLKHMCR